MTTITFSEAAKLKSYVWEHFKVNLHIHDTCGGGLFFSLEEHNEKVIEFVVAYFQARGIKTEISSDRLSVFLLESNTSVRKNISILYEAEKHRTAAYDVSDVPSDHHIKPIKQNLIGECSYREENNSWIIEHTYVKETHRNQQIAKKLVALLIEEASKRGIPIMAECSYAKKWLQSSQNIHGV